LASYLSRAVLIGPEEFTGDAAAVAGVSHVEKAKRPKYRYHFREHSDRKSRGTVTDFRPAAQTSYFEPFHDVVRRIVLPAPREKVVPHRDCR